VDQSEGAHSGHYATLTIDPINRWQRRCSRMASAAQAPSPLYSWAGADDRGGILLFHTP